MESHKICVMFTIKPPFVIQRGLNTKKRLLEPRTEGEKFSSVRITNNQINSSISRVYTYKKIQKESQVIHRRKPQSKTLRKLFKKKEPDEETSGSKCVALQEKLLTSLNELLIPS